MSAPPCYNALSYCWGDKSAIEEIEVAGRAVKVSRNLKEALEHLDLAIGELIWADAISINQEDSFEKSYQVNMMRIIYSKAKMVTVWLGVETRYSRLAANFLIDLSQSWDSLNTKLQAKASLVGSDTEH